MLKIDPDVPVYSISIAASILGLHEQTIRFYEQRGLITPFRTKGKTRLYSENDLKRLEYISFLVHKRHINLSGVKVILEIEERKRKSRGSKFLTSTFLKQKEVKMERIFRAKKGLFLSIAIGSFLAGILLASSLNWTACTKATPRQEGSPSPSTSIITNSESPFVAVAAKVMPAVVNIKTKKIVKTPGGGFHFEFKGPFDDFFKDFFKEWPEMPPQERRIEGQGSGIIIDKKGLILTNNHVVAGGGELTVKLSDKREFKGQLAGADPKTDLAVIRIKLDKDLPDEEVATLGNSDEIKVGDWAIAVGNPFGLERTVTVGVISAKGRTGLDIGPGPAPVYQDFIQTDASINFGNSGGPLVNIHGEVIGINTAINPMGQGIGFAIPVNLAKKIYPQLVEKGKIVRGYLGILPQEITENLAEGLGLKSTEGVLVAKVEQNTPAEKAGLKEGDVITKFDGKPVTTVEKFRLMVAETPVGKEVEIAIIRDKQEKKLRAKIGETPTTEVAAAPEKEEKPWLGLKVAEATGDEARRLGIKEKEGVVVTEVEAGSAADDAGIRQGDIIKKIGSKAISNLSDYSSAVRTYKGEKKPIVFLIKRGEYTTFVAVKPT